MANNYRYVEAVRDAEGFIIDGDYAAWDCSRCGHEVQRYRGQSDVDCRNCGACYNASGQRLRDHGEYMRVGSFKTMSEDKRKRLLSWWKMLRDNDLVVEFDPNIEPYPGMAGGGFRYVPRTIEDDDLLIRVNEHTNLTDEGEMIWCWPPDIEELLN
ncbi:repressor-like protein [Mycobacterium phage Chy4]|uniref:repressor-like protein n=1 Tax=Mycobacterium phage Chy4 TaxID=1327947 RepID=UPI00032B921B|nr:repressor-like protein [Mycobacterium phage Chy4]AGK86033.1 repressor-like protein [Mycobacterium phage Chy4]